jgi:hypothetical protein
MVYNQSPERSSVEGNPSWQGRGAWRWLHGSTLIKPERGMNGQNGYVVLTDLGRKTTRDHKALLEASRVLPENLIHSRILARIRPDFRAEYYDKAVQDAFKQVEDETRTAALLEHRVSGEDVFKRAFDKESPLYMNCSKQQDEMQFSASPTEYTAIRRALETRKSNRRRRRGW